MILSTKIIIPHWMRIIHYRSSQIIKLVSKAGYLPSKPQSLSFSCLSKKTRKVTLIRSYSLSAQILASSVALTVSFNSSILRNLDLSPPNIFAEAASSFSIFKCKEAKSDESVWTVSKALDRSENALFTASIIPRYSWSFSCNIMEQYGMCSSENIFLMKDSGPEIFYQFTTTHQHN